jgi:hypothetical protein
MVPSQALAEDMRHYILKSLTIVDSVVLASTVVEPESLFVQIPKQIERFNAHIGSLDSALQKAPVILPAICVDCAVNVRNCMVSDLMCVILLKVIVRRKRIRKENRACANIFADFFVQSLFASIARNRSTNLSTALQDSDYQRLVASASSLIFRARTCLCILRESPPMKVSSTSTVFPLPPSRTDDFSCIARRMRCIMNQADF